MRYFIFLISAFILISCAEEKHDFIFGKYEYKAYYQGEVDELVTSSPYDGTVFNDTLFLTNVTFGREYRRQSCAPDTGYFYKDVLAIPLKKRFNRLLNHYTGVSTSYYLNGEAIDTCIRNNRSTTPKFSVTKDYIEVIWCNDGSNDCNPKEAYVSHFMRPKQYQ